MIGRVFGVQHQGYLDGYCRTDCAGCNRSFPRTEHHCDDGWYQPASL